MAGHPGSKIVCAWLRQIGRGSGILAFVQYYAWAQTALAIDYVAIYNEEVIFIRRGGEPLLPRGRLTPTHEIYPSSEARKRIQLYAKLTL